ncbi:MAG: tRNA (adenosine(37)-N6)-threonylcarbamoyltransferase complex transferase subunit TsaD [Gemmataceae bacterium]|nr:tRNA (adenosine(37)-N6)-threonylcarbamoyltransferase complex transferase subunit TsaD [Gemmataceae bacterium]
MLFLAIETSCDETSVAIFDDQFRIHANVVASQTELHSQFRGVVPEVAARAHLQRLLPTIDEALQRANVRLNDLGAIAVLNTPGLVGALLVGVSAAKMLAFALDVPLIAANHVEAHIYACRLAAERDIFPCIGLVVSGGHSHLFECVTALQFRLLGGTIDDAAGEAFDKVAAILGLGFPGGPAVEREAMGGDPKAYDFPRSFLHSDRFEFSFSGLKTAVLYAVHGAGVSRGPLPEPGPKRQNLAASFQEAVVDALAAKCRLAIRRSGIMRLAVGGGVSANQRLRDVLAEMCAREGAELIVPPLRLCTDNAAMAAIAVEKWKLGDFSTLDLDASPTYQGINKKGAKRR